MLLEISRGRNGFAVEELLGVESDGRVVVVDKRNLKNRDG